MEIGTSREGGTRLSWYVPLDVVEEGFGAADTGLSRGGSARRGAVVASKTARHRGG